MTTSDITVLVLGLGNTLLTDEAAGVRVIEHLQSWPPDTVKGLRLLDGGTMGLTLLVDMEDADALVVVDAAYLDEEPGAVAIFEGAAMDDFLRRRGRNPHDIGLDDLMDALRLREAVPENRALVAIQPASIALGETLSDCVAPSIPLAAQKLVEMTARWRA